MTSPELSTGPVEALPERAAAEPAPSHGESLPMNLYELLALPEAERERRGVIHTAREIAQQPSCWRATVPLVFERRSDLKSILAAAGLWGDRKPSLLLAGAGSSDYIGGASAALLRKRWGCHVEALASTDLLTHTDELLLVDHPYVGIHFSRSGNSPESVAVLERMLTRSPSAPQLAVTCDARGTFARELASRPGASVLTLQPEANDRGLAMTSSFTSMVVAAQCLAHLDAPERCAEIVEELARAAETLLPRADAAAAALARQRFSQICFLGSGPLAAVARESALKVLELTAGRVPTVWETFLGVRHGPLSALNRESLVVALLSSSPQARAYELDLLEEIRRKSISRRLVVLSPISDGRIEHLGDLTLPVELPESISDDYRAPVAVLLGQLLGLHSSLAHGLRPDTPSPDGVIQRVVSF